jgi:GTP cyclohydrolase I
MPSAELVTNDRPCGPVDVAIAPALRLCPAEPGFDVRGAERAIAELLVALGQDPSSPHLADTPRRVAAAFVEVLTPQPFDLTTFPNDEGYDELVVVRDIPFHSLCQHHLLPFEGLAHVGYLPGTRVVGLSKLARAVDFFARGLQTQERLTSQIAGALQEHLEPKGVGVILQAQHLCMTLRGAGASGSTTLTSAVHGLLRSDAGSRSELFSLVRGP